MGYRVYVAACANTAAGGGIYRYELADGKLTEKQVFSVDRPMYLKIDSEQLYTLLRTPCADSEESALAVYPLTGDGAVQDATLPLRFTGGKVACHHSVIGEDVYTVNYLSGNVTLIREHGTAAAAMHEGLGVNPRRQEMPHTHCVIPSPCGKYVLATDLGIDSVFVYDRLLHPVSVAKVPKGHGARHIIFSKSGKYLFCVNELLATVTLCSFEAGKLTPLSTTSLEVDYGAHPDNLAAAVRLSRDGGLLYVSNRGEDTVCVLAFDEAREALTLLKKTPCGGKTPRDFDITPDGKYLVSTNMDSGTVTVLAMGEDGMPGAVIDSIQCPAPLCVVFQ